MRNWASIRFKLRSVSLGINIFQTMRPAHQNPSASKSLTVKKAKNVRNSPTLNRYFRTKRIKYQNFLSAEHQYLRALSIKFLPVNMSKVARKKTTDNRNFEPNGRNLIEGNNIFLALDIYLFQTEVKTFQTFSLSLASIFFAFFNKFFFVEMPFNFFFQDRLQSFFECFIF